MKSYKNDPRLTAYALGELAPEERLEFEAILESSPEAKLLVRRIRKQAGDLRAEFLSEPLSAIAQPVRSIRSFKRYFYSAGAGVLIAALVWGVFSVNGPLQKGSEAQRRAKVLLDPPAAPVEVSAEFPAVKIDLDGKNAQFSPGVDGLLVRSSVLSHAQDVRRCYDNYKSDVAEGLINIEMEIDRTGRASQVVASGNTLKSAALADCLVERFGSWNFPRASSDAAKILYPVRFFY